MNPVGYVSKQKQSTGTAYTSEGVWVPRTWLDRLVALSTEAKKTTISKGGYMDKVDLLIGFCQSAKEILK
jgi:hypothetical protein